MDYKTYLEEIFTNYTVSNELNINYGGDGTILVVKNLGGGQNYLDSKIQPIQILAYTNDVKTTLDTLAEFAQTYSGTTFQQDLEYIRQSYSTPMVLNTGSQGGANHYSQISLLGTLIISTNISDIKIVNIDGFDYFTTSRTLSYSTIEDTQPDSNRLGESNIKSGILTFVISMEHKNNDLCSKARQIREGNREVDNSFAIKLTYTDNDYEETYTMKLHSSSISSNNQLSPIITMTFLR